MQSQLEVEAIKALEILVEAKTEKELIGKTDRYLKLRDKGWRLAKSALALYKRKILEIPDNNEPGFQKLDKFLLDSIAENPHSYNNTIVISAAKTALIHLRELRKKERKTFRNIIFKSELDKKLKQYSCLINRYINMIEGDYVKNMIRTLLLDLSKTTPEEFTKEKIENMSETAKEILRRWPQ